MRVAAAMLWAGQRRLCQCSAITRTNVTTLTPLAWAGHWTRTHYHYPLQSRDYGGQYEQFSECHIISFDFHKICNEMQWNREFDALVING